MNVQLEAIDVHNTVKTLLVHIFVHVNQVSVCHPLIKSPVKVCQNPLFIHHLFICIKDTVITDTIQFIVFSYYNDLWPNIFISRGCEFVRSWWETRDLREAIFPSTTTSLNRWIKYKKTIIIIRSIVIYLVIKQIPVTLTTTTLFLASPFQLTPT